MRNILSLSFVLISFLFFISCEKDLEKVTVNKDDMLYIETVESYFDELSMVSNMDYEQLLKWQQGHNFNSIGVQALKSYNELSESFTGDISKLKSQISNNKFLNLTQNKQEEYEVELVFSNNPNRFFANDDGLFIVGDKVAKVFEKTTVVTEIENIDYLKTITESEVMNLTSNEQLLFWNNSVTSSVITKSSSCNFINDSKVARATDGGDRVKITLGAYEVQVVTGILNGYVIGEIRPYVRRFGVWWHCSRTISGSFKIAYQNKEGSGWSETYQASWYQPSVNASSRSAYILGPTYITETNSLNIVGYDCWGRSNAVPNEKAILQCDPGQCE